MNEILNSKDKQMRNLDIKNEKLNEKINHHVVVKNDKLCFIHIEEKVEN